MTTPIKDFFADLIPEELEPRLELQVFIDPLGLLTQATNNCCRDGGNCQEAVFGCDNNCRDSGNCNVESAFSPLTRKVS